MSTILLRLSAVNYLALLATFAVGLASFFQNGNANGAPVSDLHFYLGLFAVLSTLAVHCLVFIYFLGTGRWVKEVALAYQMADDPLPKLTRDLKRRAFPPALFSMLTAIAAAVVGMPVRLRQGWPWQLHLGLALVTLAVNAWAFVVEYRCVVTNAGVIDDVMGEVDRIRAAHGLPSNAEAIRQEEEQHARGAG